MARNIVFGPVPSRRLGYSLGVNNVFDKYCTYSCIYCQAGLTTRLIVERRRFYDPYKLAETVVKAARERDPDVISFVPNGEPTLDINLGLEAKLIRQEIDKPLAVFTNSSLLHMDDVVSDLTYFDIVSVKVDTVYEETWRRLNRPHPALNLNLILNSIRDFTKTYKGKVITETMIVAGVNDRVEEYLGITSFLKELRIDKAYIQIPVRPPAEKWVKPPREEEILKAYRVFIEALGEDRVGLLTATEPSTFKFSNDLVRDIANTIYVHPIRLEYVYELARGKGADPSRVIHELLDKGYAIIIEYMGDKFLVARSHSRPR